MPPLRRMSTCSPRPRASTTTAHSLNAVLELALITPKLFKLFAGSCPHTKLRRLTAPSAHCYKGFRVHHEHEPKGCDDEKWFSGISGRGGCGSDDDSDSDQFMPAACPASAAGTPNPAST